MTCLEPYTVNVCSSQVAEEGRDISVTIEEIEPVKNSKGSLKVSEIQEMVFDYKFVFNS
jgi:hypothetical protein